MTTLVDEIKKFRQGQTIKDSIDHMTVEWDLPNEYFGEPITTETMMRLSHYIDDKLREYSAIYGTNPGLRSSPMPLQMTDEARDMVVECVEQTNLERPENANVVVQPAAVDHQEEFARALETGHQRYERVMNEVTEASKESEENFWVENSQPKEMIPIGGRAVEFGGCDSKVPNHTGPEISYGELLSQGAVLEGKPAGEFSPADQAHMRHDFKARFELPEPPKAQLTLYPIGAPGSAVEAQFDHVIGMPLVDPTRDARTQIGDFTIPESATHMPVSVDHAEEDAYNRTPFLYRVGNEPTPGPLAVAMGYQRNSLDRLEIDGPASMQELREGSLDRTVILIDGVPTGPFPPSDQFEDGEKIVLPNTSEHVVDDLEIVDEHVCQSDDYRGFVRRNYALGERVIRLPAGAVPALSPMAEKTSYITSYNIFAKAQPMGPSQPVEQIGHRIRCEPSPFILNDKISSTISAEPELNVIMAKIEARIITVPAGTVVGDEIWYEYCTNEESENKNLHPIRKLIKTNLTIMAKSRVHECSYDTTEGPEQVALESLREMITETEFRHYLKYGFLNVRGQSGLLYQILKNSMHIRVWEKGRKIEEICIGLKDSTAVLTGANSIPLTDRVLAMKILIETDEAIVRAGGNVYKMKKAG